MFNIQPIPPFISIDERERQDLELWNAISTAIYMCGFNDEDVTMEGIEVLKKIGRYDMLPLCGKE